MKSIFNPILATDSYKLSHPGMYIGGITGMYSYITARVSPSTIIIPFGPSMWLQKFMSVKITREHVDEAIVFCKAHGEPFDADMWYYIVDMYSGDWPVVIKAVPEGLPIPGGSVMLTIEATDKYAASIVSHLETALLRGVWYPSTIATLDYDVKKIITHYYKISGADMAGIDFALHDFGGRGVTSAEQAEIGGAAHLVNFRGSDTVEGVRAANIYYRSNMSAFSVPATEHSIECSFGDDGESDYLKHILTNFAKPNSIVSIVIDGYDVYRAADKLCTEFKDMILASGAKVVFRPDSGDMMEVVPRILAMQEKAFGFTMTKKGYKKINTVGILQGDGVDREKIAGLLGQLLLNGYSADNVVLGSGGGLLQKVNRDTLKFAQKMSAIRKERKVIGAHGGATIEEWVGIRKNPITDPGKASLSGRVGLFRSALTGEYRNYDIDTKIDSEYVPVLETVYDCGYIYPGPTLEEIRNRCNTY